jgi:hypothetical protein
MPPGEPHTPQQREGAAISLRLASTLSDPSSASEIAAAWEGTVLPLDLIELWSVCRDARLFRDVDFGQWGLALLDPASSAARTAKERAARPTDFRTDDVVVGTFLGDQELLILAPGELDTRRVLIALPLDNREDWFGVAHTLAEFLLA